MSGDRGSGQSSGGGGGSLASFYVDDVFIGITGAGIALTGDAGATDGTDNHLTAVTFDVSTFADSAGPSGTDTTGAASATTTGLTIIKSGVYKVAFEADFADTTGVATFVYVNGNNFLFEVDNTSANKLVNPIDGSNIIVLHAGDTLSAKAGATNNTTMTALALTIVPLFYADGTPGGGGGTGDAVTAKDATVNTVADSYSDTMKWMTFASDDAAFAWGLEGDEFPRVVLMSDPTDAVWYLGDGTFDPMEGNYYGPTLNTTDGAMEFTANAPVSFRNLDLTAFGAFGARAQGSIDDSVRRSGWFTDAAVSGTYYVPDLFNISEPTNGYPTVCLLQLTGDAEINMPAGASEGEVDASFERILIIDDGGFAVTWPDSGSNLVAWDGGVAPTLGPSKRAMISIRFHPGTSYIGTVLGTDYRAS